MMNKCNQCGAVDPDDIHTCTPAAAVPKGAAPADKTQELKPAPVQEPVAWVDLLKQAEEVVRSQSLWKKYIDGTPLAIDIAVWMADFAQQYTTQPAAQRQWVGLNDYELSDAYVLGGLRLVQEKIKWRNHVDNKQQAPIAVVVECRVQGGYVEMPDGSSEWTNNRNWRTEVISEIHLEPGTKVYTTPPAAPVPLTVEQIHALDPAPHCGFDQQRIDFARAIEAAHGITKGGSA
jgi:hypothetical protein